MSIYKTRNQLMPMLSPAHQFKPTTNSDKLSECHRGPFYRICRSVELAAAWGTRPTMDLQIYSAISCINDTAIEPRNARCQAAITVLYSHHQTAIWKGVSTMRLSAWTKIFISVMTLILTDMLRPELFLAETSTTRTSL